LKNKGEAENLNRVSKIIKLIKLYYMVAGGMFILMIVVLLYLAVIALLIISSWKINTKAGQEGWACLIPIYSILILLRIARAPWWWILLMCIPFAGLVWSIWMINRVNKGFGKSDGFTVGCIFLPFIFLPILGLGPATYDPERLELIE